ncbi:hypothetical protein, partial [Novacetimonas hansenii]|uniref:hypothetical protein n=1 Tax=Novacetimonas hansenii TaxID=436 RepID=UPI001A7EB5A8
SEDAAFLEKGGTQKFFLFFINELLSNSLLGRLFKMLPFWKWHLQTLYCKPVQYAPIPYGLSSDIHKTIIIMCDNIYILAHKNACLYGRTHRKNLLLQAVTPLMASIRF